VLRTLVLIIVGFLPSLISFWVIRKTQLRARARMRQAAMNLSRRQVEQYFHPIGDDCALPGAISNDNLGFGDGATPSLSDRYYLEGVGYLVGDISCKYNARSGYVRCAVNPSGPCQGCRHYEPRELASSENKV
jgi:hypothetical protein